jgi:hypothetical protein
VRGGAHRNAPLWQSEGSSNRAPHRTKLFYIKRGRGFNLYTVEYEAGGDELLVGRCQKLHYFNKKSCVRFVYLVSSSSPFTFACVHCVLLHTAY